MTVDLHKTFPRRFVPSGAYMGKWEEIERVGGLLLRRPLDSVEGLERWLEDVGEFTACMEEERTRRYVAMTCQTDDQERERAYLTFVQEIEPRAKPLKHALNQAYLASPARSRLPERYRLLDRQIANGVALYRDENVPLEVEEAELKLRYQKLTGAMSVVFRGEELTLQQMGRFLEVPERDTRQEAWRLVARRRLQDRDALEEIFERLLALRQTMARNAGFDNYREYVFPLYERFDYGPEECFRFHDAVQRHFLPLLNTLREERRTRLGVTELRPWDLRVDPHNRSPLRPFDGVEELLDRTEAVFRSVDSDLGDQFHFLRKQGLLDLESRKGKAPGGYQQDYTERRLPFIFMNAVGVDTDIRVLLHEGGHAFHALAARENAIYAYRFPPTEFAEVGSMAMELLAIPFLDAFYPEPENLRRAIRERLEIIPTGFCWFATIDAFQHWIYTHPQHSRKERRAAWVHTFGRFESDLLDWSGYEEEHAYAWHGVLHPFLYPFYYIEYGIALTGAMQVWLRSRADYREAVGRYRDALALGGTRRLPELFAAAGAKLAFDDETIAPLAQALGAELRASMGQGAHVDRRP